MLLLRLEACYVTNYSDQPGRKHPPQKCMHCPIQKLNSLQTASQTLLHTRGSHSQLIPIQHDTTSDAYNRCSTSAYDHETRQPLNSGSDANSGTVCEW